MWKKQYLHFDKSVSAIPIQTQADSCICHSDTRTVRQGEVRYGGAPRAASVDLFICHNAMRCRGTWQRPHCDLFWTNDSAKRPISHSHWIKSWRGGQPRPKPGDEISCTLYFDLYYVTDAVVVFLYWDAFVLLWDI